MYALQTEDLTLGYGEHTVIDELNLLIPKGEMSVLIGGNGCGKSTLLRSLARLLKPHSGGIVLDGEAISNKPTKEIARKMAILPQSPVAPEGLTVLQLVKQGRYPYQTWLSQWSEADEQAVQKALRATHMEEFAERNVDSLSGGQRQRAWIALTLAQDTDIILLDEPTTYLDLAHQVEVLDLLFELNKEDNRTILMVLHDLNLACRYADHIIAVKDKGIYDQGKPEDIVNEELVQQVFGLRSDIIEDPLFGTPLCVPHGKGRKVHGRNTAKV